MVSRVLVWALSRHCPEDKGQPLGSTGAFCHGVRAQRHWLLERCPSGLHFSCHLSPSWHSNSKGWVPGTQGLTCCPAPTGPDYRYPRFPQSCASYCPAETQAGDGLLPAFQEARASCIVGQGRRVGVDRLLLSVSLGTWLTGHGFSSPVLACLVIT